jgi:hypothetical protein
MSNSGRGGTAEKLPFNPSDLNWHVYPETAPNRSAAVETYRNI